jgi:hypothetical protein
MSNANAAGVIRLLPLVARTMVSLLVFDVAVAVGDYKRVHAMTRKVRVKKKATRSDTIPNVCWAVEEACVWYPKRALCLQRSTVATWALRRHGIPAELVIGYRPVPIDSHAWVEVDGRIVNDRPQYQKFYQVMDRL